jgi:hypothetical protein
MIPPHITTTRLLRRGLVVLAVLAVLVSLGAAGAFTAGATFGGTAGRVEAASTAIPAAPGAVTEDLSVHYTRMHGQRVQASGVATSSASCPGCTAHAVTLQVLYARSVTTLAADNVAAAWTSCTQCRASALSVQVVVARRAGTVVAGNRSLALNVACLRCRTAAAAIQIVVVSPSSRPLSAAALARLSTLRDQLQAQLLAQLAAPAPSARPGGAAPSARPDGATLPSLNTDRGSRPAPRTGIDPLAAAVDAGAANIQAIVATDLGAVSADHTVDVHAG